ncbi:hypothetical protein F511_32496 [Dorcoceras hygrometricum]|uniref:Uncharacterized protein n=1 Tax=Dorcoceras hygrometricum TaxID=472368 RepID=A0A2Z7D6Y9_9LAMI|nr:hypothetical protein F511_32496 [Dorcoceras hygrometricum]
MVQVRQLRVKRNLEAETGFCSSPPATIHADIKLEEVEKVVVSLDSRMTSMDSKVQSIDSTVKSMDSRVGYLDSKVEELLNIQTFMKHDFGIYKRAFYDKMDTMACNVTSSQTSLETSLVPQLSEHQYQLASDIDFVKLQLAEILISNQPLKFGIFEATRRRVAKNGNAFNGAVLSSYKHLRRRRKFNLDADNVSLVTPWVRVLTLSLILYKLYEMEVQKRVDEHLANFKPTEPSVNYDYMCIRFLSKELKEIARQHKDLRVLAGLPIVAPEASLAGDVVSTETLQITLSSPAQPRIPALEFSTQDEQEQEVARKADQSDEQIEMVDQIVELVEDIVHENLDTMSAGQVLEQPAPEAEDQPQNSPGQSTSRHGSRSSASYLSMHSSQGASMRFYPDSNQSYNKSPTSSGSLPIHNEDHVNNLGFCSSPPATIHADIKLEEVEKVVVSLDSRMTSMDSKVQSIDSTVKSMDSRVGYLDSKVEELLNIQTFMKHDFGIYKRAFYDKMDTMAVNVTSSQTSLETSLVPQLSEHQYQLASDIDFVKLQLAEILISNQPLKFGIFEATYSLI